MNQHDLDQILKDHKTWLKDHSKGKKADLRYADLSYADLSYAKSLKFSVDCLSEMFKKIKAGL